MPGAASTGCSPIDTATLGSHGRPSSVWTETPGDAPIRRLDRAVTRLPARGVIAGMRYMASSWRSRSWSFACATTRPVDPRHATAIDDQPTRTAATAAPSRAHRLESATAEASPSPAPVAPTGPAYRRGQLRATPGAPRHHHLRRSREAVVSRPTSSWPDAWPARSCDELRLRGVLGRTDRRHPDRRSTSCASTAAQRTCSSWSDSRDRSPPDATGFTDTSGPVQAAGPLPIGRHPRNDVLAIVPDAGLPALRRGVQWRMTADGRSNAAIPRSRRRCWPPWSSPPVPGHDFVSPDSRVGESGSDRLCNGQPRPSRRCRDVALDHVRRRHSPSRSSIGTDRRARDPSVRDGAPHRPERYPSPEYARRVGGWRRWMRRRPSTCKAPARSTSTSSAAGRGAWGCNVTCKAECTRP